MPGHWLHGGTKPPSGVSLPLRAWPWAMAVPVASCPLPPPHGFHCPAPVWPLCSVTKEEVWKGRPWPGACLGSGQEHRPGALLPYLVYVASLLCPHVPSLGPCPPAPGALALWCRPPCCLSEPSPRPHLGADVPGVAGTSFSELLSPLSSGPHGSDPDGLPWVLLTFPLAPLERPWSEVQAAPCGLAHSAVPAGWAGPGISGEGVWEGSSSLQCLPG